MKLARRNSKRAMGRLWFMVGWLLLGAHVAPAENVILHLRNGDRIQGAILSENTNGVVLGTTWIKELPVPASAILRREAVTNSAPATATAQPATPKTTNTVAPAPAPAVVAAKPAPPPPKPKRWKATLNVGTDMQFGAHDRELFYARAKLNFDKPYKSDPKKFFRSILDYSVDYGRTDGVKSADRMDTSLKTDFDLGRRFYVYNLARAGYDEVRKIDFQYEVGPGMGYHLFTRPKFVMNTELGANYQVQERADSPDVQKFYYRIAEDVTWKINARLNLTEKAELFPQVENPEEFRARIEATLSFALWLNITFNVSILDLYDTKPASGVEKNEFQIRSSLGVTF